LVSLVVVVLASGPDLGKLREIHADSARVYQPGRVAYDYWGNPWDSSRFNPFNSTGVFFEILLLFGYLISVCLIGAAVLRRLLPLCLEARPSGVLFSGFLAGYVIVLPFIRIFLDIFARPYGSQLSLITVFGLGVLSFRDFSRWNSGLRDLIRNLAGIATALVVSFIYRIQSGRNFMVSDSLIVFIDRARDVKENASLRYIPSWDQQSDEWVFTAPGIFRNSRIGLEALWYTGTTAMGIVSLVGCLILIGNLILPTSKQLFINLSSVTIVLFGTTALIPITNISLIGGQNPLIFLGHTGRYVGILAPIIGALVLLNLQDGQKVQRGSAIVIAFSLGFFSPQTFIYLILGMIVFCFMRSSRRLLPRHSLQSRMGPIPLPYLSLCIGAVVYSTTPAAGRLGETFNLSQPAYIGFLLLCPMVLFVLALLIAGLPEKHTSARGISFFTLCALGLSLLFVAWAPTTSSRFTWVLGSVLIGVPMLYGFILLLGIRKFRLSVATVVVAGVACFGGMLLSGNLSSQSGLRRLVVRVLDDFLPGLAQPLESRGLASITAGARLGYFSGVECWISGHCLSGAGFLLSYGSVFVLAIAAYRYVSTQNDSALSGQGSHISIIVAGSSAAILFGLFITDFTGGSELATNWALTRFIEPALYFSLFVSLRIITSRQLRLANKILVSCLVITWCLPTFIIAVPQWLQNAQWLIRTI